MVYIVKLDQFEGPLDLLLQLIEKEKLDITQLSLAKITDQYLEYLKKIDKIELQVLCDFLIIATKLLLIKSRYLLPCFQVLEEEEEIDSKDLEEKLFRYKKIKEQAKILQNLINRKECFYERSFSFKRYQGFFPPKDLLKKEDLRNLFEKVLERISQEEKFSQGTIEKVVSLQEKILQIKNLILNKQVLSFQEIVKKTEKKIEIIVAFLALLELTKQKEILIKQEGIFEEIRVINLK